MSEGVFAWLAVGAGLLAAALWLVASRVRVDPGWDAIDGQGVPVDQIAQNTGWIIAHTKAVADAGRWNAWAAGVTAGAALLQAASLAAHRLGL